MRKFMMIAAMTAMAIPAIEAPAQAHRTGYSHHHGRHYYPAARGYRCRSGKGTTGLIAGGAAGALLGRSIDTRGERTTGTVLGAAAGALLGREVQRSGQRDRCYR